MCFNNESPIRRKPSTFFWWSMMADSWYCMDRNFTCDSPHLEADHPKHLPLILTSVGKDKTLSRRSVCKELSKILLICWGLRQVVQINQFFEEESSLMLLRDFPLLDVWRADCTLYDPANIALQPRDSLGSRSLDRWEVIELTSELNSLYTMDSIYSEWCRDTAYHLDILKKRYSDVWRVRYMEKTLQHRWY